MAVWSVVRYKLLEGCVDQFLKEAQRLENGHLEEAFRFSIRTKTDEDELIQICAQTGVDQLIDI